jgi:putative glutamine amidotransferase
VKVVAVSQRVDVWADRGERRDALDQRLCLWLVTAGCVPVPVPNSLMVAGDAGELWLQRWLEAVKPDAVLLSGGNDIGGAPERDNTERSLLAYAKDQALPVLGICRGMQMMGVWAGASLVPVERHAGTQHQLQVVEGPDEWPSTVNSFHNFALSDCPPGFAVSARAGDGTIEAMCHAHLPWEGWMWHPERERDFSLTDIDRLRALFHV